MQAQFCVIRVGSVSIPFPLSNAMPASKHLTPVGLDRFVFPTFSRGLVSNMFETDRRDFDPTLSRDRVPIFDIGTGKVEPPRPGGLITGNRTFTLTLLASLAKLISPKGFSGRFCRTFG
jgi:hypothetical protein